MSRLLRLIGGLPHEVKRPLKRVLYAPWEVLNRQHHDGQPLPPRWLMFDSSGDFIATGKHLLELCTEFGGLVPDHKILDVGCGVGRLAIPMSNYLSEQGSYSGFDVDAAAINWCRRHVGVDRRGFSFRHVTVSNDHYNRSGAEGASAFTFPYDDAQFDLVVATSLFTHLYAADATRYLAEVSRVLKPGGRALITWYIMDNDDSRGKKADMDFHHRLDDYTLTSNPANPCAAIAFKKEFVLDNYAGVELTLDDPIHQGGWRGEPGPTYQDMIVASKRV